jgi:hypothetical protein
MLERARVLVEEFPAVRLFVTDIVPVPRPKVVPRPNPDPFIAATMDWSDDQLFVFGVWDEPGFE